MATKRQNGKASEDAPAKKSGRFEETDPGNEDMELDDEVEKELREFEQLKSTLTATTNGVLENNNNDAEQDGSDMEVDHDLEQETADARMKTYQHQKADTSLNYSEQLDEMGQSSKMQMMPDTLADETGRPEGGEEACLNSDLARLNRKSPRFDRLNTDASEIAKLGNLISKSIEAPASPEQSPRRRKSEDDDPDFVPSKSRSRSRRTGNRSRSHQLEKTFTPPKLPRVVDEVQKPTAQNHIVDQPMQRRNGRTSTSKSQALSKGPAGLKETFVDPAVNLANPSKAKSVSNEDGKLLHSIVDNPKPSCSKAYQTERASPETQESVSSLRERQPYVRNINFDPPTQENKLTPPKLIKSAPCLTETMKAPTPSSNSHPTPPKPQRYVHYINSAQSSTTLELPVKASPESQPANVTIDISDDQPAEYCTVELIMQWRYKNTSLLDEEKLGLIEAGRPGLWCPKMLPYATFYRSQPSLAACNELNKFFCWPCLLFSSKPMWSVTCNQQSEAILGKEVTIHMQTAGHQESISKQNIWSSKKKSTTIPNLLENNFVDGTWTDEEQEAILMKGRPRPILDSKTHAKSTIAKKAAFDEFYNKFSWICGCTSGQFFCWPCVLFTRDYWSYSGTIHSSEFSSHETSLTHMEACIKFGKWEFDLKKKSAAKFEQNRKTRDFLMSLVEVICAEKKKNNNTASSAIDYLESLELMSQYHTRLKAFIDENGILSVAKTVHSHLSAILNSIDYFIKIGILDEIKKSNFVSLIFDHSSGESHKSVLSVIASFVNEKGEVCERFVKLLNVGYNTSFTSLVDEVLQIIVELQCRSTLVGFTYDGYLVKPGDIPEFNAKVRKMCPNAKFFHYREHNFKRVLKQTLNHDPVCQRVLQVVQELASFFENMPGARKTLKEIIESTKMSKLDDNFWRSPDFIKVIFANYAIMVQIMDSISKNAKDWKVKVVVQARNFLNFFKDATSRLYVTVIAHMFGIVDDLTTALDNDVSVEESKPVAGSTALKLQKLGRNFDDLLDSACSHLEARNQETTRREMSSHREKIANTVRFVVKLVKNRVFELEPGYFRLVIPPSSSHMPSLMLKRKNLLLQSVNLPSNFNCPKLLREIQFFHDTPILFGNNLPKIITNLQNYNMINVLPELFKFLQLALTAPRKLYQTPTTLAVRRIASYVEGKRDLNFSDALIWMEKEFLANLQKDVNFYGKVVDRALAIVKTNSI